MPGAWFAAASVDMSEPIYIIVKAGNSDRLVTEVKLLLGEGFQCVGGVSHVIDSYPTFDEGQITGGDCSEIWSQAMMRKP